MTPYYLCKFEVLTTYVKDSNKKPQKLLQHIYLGKKMIFYSRNVQNAWCYHESHQFQLTAIKIKSLK